MNALSIVRLFVPAKYRTRIRKLSYIIFPMSFREKVRMIINTILGDKANPWAERMTNLGALNSKNKILIIRKYPKGMGLLSCYLTFLGQLEFADKKNYKPVIDMKTIYYPGVHNSFEELNEINAWECYFMPLNELKIEDAYCSKEVILGSGFTKPNVMELFDETEITTELIKKWTIVDEKYIHLQPSLEKNFYDDYINLIGDKRVIGVMIREDYIALANSKQMGSAPLNGINISGHPVQPTTSDLIAVLRSKMGEWNCNYIFVSAATTNIIDSLKEEFGDIVLFTNRERRTLVDFTERSLQESAKVFFQTQSIEKINIEYLKEIYMLSKCTCLISGKCSGSVVASLWNRNKYEHLKIFSLGTY